MTNKMCQSNKVSGMYYEQPSKNTALVGKRSEEIAEDFLRERNYKIIERNYREKTGEIDLVAFDTEKKVICFIEVKKIIGLPNEITYKVNLKKQKHIINTANIFLNKRKIAKDVGIRFDIIAIRMPGPNPCAKGRNNIEIYHYENAFNLEGFI